MEKGNIKAYILVVTSIGKETDVVSYIKQFSEIKAVNAVYGEYDVVAEVEVEDLNKLNQLMMKIRKNSSILKTVTLIAM
ncbi:AsnC family transcriptional regulator [Sulfolobales archaeon HS-7]|nr:AsnC family transcriptional regulator [Sulfolobales archaeon HS-7]